MAKTGKTQQEIQYALFSILTIKYSFILPKQKFEREKPDLINFIVNPIVSFKVQQENVIINMDVRGLINETQETILEISTAFAFKVPKLDSFLEDKHTDGTEKWAFKDSKNKQFLAMLIGVSYSTMRGIIIERSRGTILENIYLPIVDPNIFVK